MSAETVAVRAEQDEARQLPRFTCEVPTTCQPPSSWSKDPWPATIRDISSIGLSLTLNRRFEKGSGLAIELPGEDGTSSTVLARVVHVQSLGQGTWLLGCKFISELGEGEVKQVLQLDPIHQARLVELPSPTPAVPAVTDVLFQARLNPGELLRWFVKRLELTGTWPLPRDKVIGMRVAGVSKQAAPIELRIRRCKQYGSYWIIDCHFVSVPAAEVLAALTAPPPAAE